MKQKIIIDTDPGIDDAMAILFAAAHADIELVALTTLFGNSTIDVVTRNALYLKKRFGLTADIAKGAAQPLIGKAKPPVNHIHGDDALGNMGLTDGDYGELHALDACDYLIENIRAHPHEITLVPIGPLTNLALALEKAPDIADLVKSVVIMGGAFGFNAHSGNVTPFAEANIYCDPLAADKVLTASWNVTVVGLDVTDEVVMSPDFFVSLKAQNQCGEFIHDIVQFYLDFYRANGMSAGCSTHDPLAVMYTVAPELLTTIKAPIRVVTDGISKGQTLAKLDKKRYGVDEWQNITQQTICRAVDAKGCLALYFKTLASFDGY